MVAELPVRPQKGVIFLIKATLFYKKQSTQETASTFFYEKDDTYLLYDYCMFPVLHFLLQGSGIDQSFKAYSFIIKIIGQNW
jgi:hypothetical protein